MAKKEIDMRILYASYTEASQSLRDPSNTPELTKILITIQDAANLDLVMGWEEGQTEFTNLDFSYGTSKPKKNDTEIIKELEEFIENVNNHTLGWKTLEPRAGPKIAHFLDTAKRFATELLHSILSKKRELESTRTKTTSLHRLPTLPSIGHKKEDTPEERMNTLDSLLTVLGFGKRDK